MLVFCSLAPLVAQPATKDDIKLILREMDKRFEQMDKRFEALQVQIDRRFAEIDKRFDEVDKRINIVLWVIGLATSLSIGASAYLFHRLNRKLEFADTFAAIESAPPEKRRALRDLLKV